MGRGQKDYTIWIGEEMIVHHPDHEKAGIDEISVKDLGGKTADFQRADNVKAEEAAERPAVPAEGDIFFATDSKVLSLGFAGSPGEWYDFSPVDETDADATKNKFVSNALAKGWQETKTALSAGIIVLWSGTLADIPAGWALCDGGVGRPDLREKFVVGAAAAVEPGGTGGAATHTHERGTYAGPSHTHGAGTYKGPVHTHGVDVVTDVDGDVDYSTGGAGEDGIEAVTDVSWGGGVGTWSGETANNIAAAITGISAAGGDAAITGTSAAGSSLPPYYGVAFIIKT